MQKKWILATPYQRNTLDPNDIWNILLTQSPDVSLTYIPPNYQHDSRRKYTNYQQWIDYWKHSKLIWKEASEKHADTIVTAFPQLAVCVALRKKLSLKSGSIKLVAWTFNLGQLKPGLKRLLSTWLLNKVNVFIVPSSQESVDYAKYFNRSTDDFRFVRYLKIPLARTVERELQAPFIVSIGAANRDFDSLIKAVTGTDIRLKIVAPQRYFHGLNLPENIETYSDLSIDECRLLTQKALMTVIPIENKNIASGQITIIEALMLGTVVIATDSSGTSDYITHGKNGFLFDHKNPENLRNIIKLIWRDSGLRDTITANGHQFVSEQLSGNKIAADLLRAIDE